MLCELFEKMHNEKIHCGEVLHSRGCMHNEALGRCRGEKAPRQGSYMKGRCAKPLLTQRGAMPRGGEMTRRCTKKSMRANKWQREALGRVRGRSRDRAGCVGRGVVGRVA